MFCESLASANDMVRNSPGVLLQYKRVKQVVLDLLRDSNDSKLPDQLLVMYIQNKETEFYAYISNDDPYRVVEYFNPVTNQYIQYTLLELLLHHDIHEVLEEMTNKHFKDDLYFKTFLRYPLKHSTISMIQNMIHAKPTRYVQYIESRTDIDSIYKDAFAHASTSAYQWRNRSTISYKMPASYKKQSI